MYFSKWLTSLLLFIVFTFIFAVSQVYAQQGCCSWHGGISHCASNGRYVCNDGTYSPSCTCGAPTYTYTPPTPKIPASTNGTWTYIKNSSGGVDLHFDWDRPDGRGYSITLNKTAGANPGPLADTTKSKYIFRDITPGKWYINVKEMMNGQWSQIAYWEVDVPSDVKSQARPLHTPTPLPTAASKRDSQPKVDEDSSNDDSMGLLTALGIAVGVPAFIVYVGKSEG